MRRTTLAEMRRSTLVCAVVVLLATAAVAAPVGGQEADPDFGATVQLPADFQVGENRVQVVVDNTGSDDELFSPMIEVPLGPSLSAPADPAPTATVDGDTEERTWAVQDSSYRQSDALFVYGEEVPAGETRTYSFTLVVEAAGDRTVEADVRPLYNEPNNVRTSTTATALATGTLNVEVTDGDGTTLPGATVSVDGADHDGGDHALSVVEGTRTVAAIAGGRTLPALSVPVVPGGTANVSFASPDSLVDPQVLATSGNGSVDADSVVRETSQAGDATRPTAFELSFTVEADEGTTVVGVGPPPEVPDSFADVSASAGSVTVADDGTLLVELSGAGPHDVVLTLEGYATGDATGDGAVDAGDARRVADAVAGTGDATGYADVDADGRVTAVDAMFVAQYAAGNRDADYRRLG